MIGQFIGARKFLISREPPFFIPFLPFSFFLTRRRTELTGTIEELTMGRVAIALSKDQKQARQREWNRKKLSDPVKLSKKREYDRLRRQEQRRQGRIGGGEQLDASENVESQVQAMAELNIRDDDEGLGRGNPDRDGIGGDDWEDEGFGNDGFGMECMTIIRISTDICRRFGRQNRRTS